MFLTVFYRKKKIFLIASPNKKWIASVGSNHRLFVSLKSAVFQEFIAKVIGRNVDFLLVCCTCLQAWLKS